MNEVAIKEIVRAVNLMVSMGINPPLDMTMRPDRFAVAWAGLKREQHRATAMGTATAFTLQVGPTGTKVIRGALWTITEGVN